MVWQSTACPGAGAAPRDLFAIPVQWTMISRVLHEKPYRAGSKMLNPTVDTKQSQMAEFMRAADAERSQLVILLTETQALLHWSSM